MTKLSRRSLGPSTERNLVQNLWGAFNSLDDLERVYFLDKILTPAEKLMLAKRLAVLKELGKGMSYEEIEEKLKVISATIARMSDILHSAPKLLPILSKIDAARKRKEARKTPVRRVAGSRTLAGTKRIFGL